MLGLGQAVHRQRDVGEVCGPHVGAVQHRAESDGKDLWLAIGRKLAQETRLSQNQNQGE